MAKPPQDDAPFFSRWSRRKLAQEQDAAPTPEPDDAPPPDAPLPDAQDAESITEEELAALPAIEELTPKSDIRPFLKKGVPQALRNAALRRKWMLVPAIRDHLDPAVDYAWDWNTPGGVPGDGAAPTPERAAQMLRELVNPRCSAEAENAQETDVVTPPDPAPEPVDSAVQKQPETTADDARTRAPDAAAQPETHAHNIKENQSTNGPDATRRRHGGALPS